jgi:hypothetical protein
MRLAAFVVTVAATTLLATLAARPAHAADAPAVDDESDAGEEDDALLEAFGPRTRLRTRAEEVSFDPRERSVELAGNVRIDSPPFHLRSQRIKVTRTRYGIEVVGKGSLAFCPCLGTPLKVDFEEAIVAPPGDLILKRPTLRFYDVPILPLPYFWLRSDEKAGVLPPDLAYRGHDGLFAGGGVHLPWKSAGEQRSLDLRAGVYVPRGFATEARLRTPSSTTRVRYDRLPGDTGDDGLLVDARGATTRGEVALAWDADVLRGRRGVAATTELDAAARPFDRATAEAALREGPLVVATAMRAVTRRGGDLGDVDAAGPVVSARASGAATGALLYDVTLEGGSLRVSGLPGAGVTAPAPTGAGGPVSGAPASSRDTLSFARGEVGARAVGALGALEASLALRGAGDVGALASRSGTDRAGSARARLAVPLVRRFEGAASASPPSAPAAAHDAWIHLIEPFAEVAVLHARGDGLLGLSPARSASAVDGTAPLADAGFTTTLGRWGARDAIEAAGSAGAAFGSRSTESGVRPLTRGRVAATLAWLGLGAEAASVFGSSVATANGAAFVGRARLGLRDGLRVLANVAVRDGLDPVLARALVDAPLEPASGFLATEGTTGGAGLVVPWSHLLTTTVGADGDATHKELVAARAGGELRDRCGCLTLRVMAAHRLGRDGVDAWIALDFAANR